MLSMQMVGARGIPGLIRMADLIALSPWIDNVLKEASAVLRDNARPT
jgi:hypothetical protein